MIPMVMLEAVMLAEEIQAAEKTPLSFLISIVLRNINATKKPLCKTGGTVQALRGQNIISGYINANGEARCTGSASILYVQDYRI